MGFPLKRWVDPASDSTGPAQLASELDVHDAVASALIRRGFSATEEARAFLSPRLSSLSDPFGIGGMSDAVEAVWAAIDSKARISVFGDYDADGVTSTALVVSVLEKLGADASAFLPERMNDGYGMSVPPMERCIDEQAPKLVISVDCGTNSVEAVEYARSRGVDVVITDHHEPQGQTAHAVAVVNPKIAGDESERQLAGVGVAFKFCHAIVKRGLGNNRPEALQLDLRDHLDLVAVGTVADIVPLTGDNRILVSRGLERLNAMLPGTTGNSRPCWRALCKCAGVDQEVGSYHVGFVLGPRLNAAGRLGPADKALEILLTRDAEKAYELARELEDMNGKRKSLEESIRKKAVRQIDPGFNPERDHGLVAADKGWHIGINGIVASRLVAKYSRPVVVISIEENGNGTGSCRSIEQLDILEVLDGCKDLLVSYGGHKMAAGLEVEEDRIEDFRKRFNDLCGERLQGSDLRSSQEIDAWVTLGDIDDSFYQQVKAMAPNGIGNPVPVFGARNLVIVGHPEKMGASQEHVRMTLGCGGREMKAVGFGLGAHDLPAENIDVLFKLRENTWRSRRTLQMHIVDIRES